MGTGEITTSRYVQFTHAGDATVLTLEPREVAKPGPGEVRIFTHAIGINRAEIMFRNGRYIYAPELPAGLGYEASGDTALITAASSSVGLAAIQIANLVGARPIALTRTSAKSERLLELGANAVIATEEEDVLAEARRLTGEAGARVIMDPVGGPMFETLTALAADHGWIVLYGGLSTEPTPLSGIHVIGKELTVHGLQIFDIPKNPERRDAAVRFSCRPSDPRPTHREAWQRRTPRHP